MEELSRGVRVVRLFASIMFLIIFILGLLIGSFLNVVICRLKIKQTILFNRSYCPKCGNVLKWHDLIPLFSFLIQKGKCRYCGKKISWQYPLVELATGLLFVLVFYKFFPDYLNLTYHLIIVSFLIIVFVYDLKHYLILDKIVFPAAVIVFIYQIINGNYFNPLLAAISASGFFLSLVLFSKGKWMGLGDVKFAFFMGLFLGWPNILLALLLSFVSGAIIGIVLISFGKKGIKSEIPFGPFLVGATVLTMFYGGDIIRMYLGFL